MTLADFVLRLLLTRRDRDAISGDLLEEYREVVLPARGARGARLWYWRQVLSFVSPTLAGLVMGATLGVLNLIGTARDPLADDTAGGMLLFAAAVLAAWSVVAFAAARRTGRFGDGLKAGVLTGVAMMAVFHLAAIVRVNLFLDVIRERGDWQNLVARFGQSGFRSLRTYANYEYVRGTPTLLAVGAVAGAVSGTMGAALSRAFGGTARASKPSA